MFTGGKKSLYKPTMTAKTQIYKENDNKLQAAQHKVTLLLLNSEVKIFKKWFNILSKSLS